MDVYKDVGVCSLEKATSGCLPLPMLRSELGHGAKHWELYMDVYMDVGVMETATSEKLGHGAQTSTEAWAPGKPKPVYEGKPCSPRGHQARFASIRVACTIAAQSPVQAPAPVASIRGACTIAAQSPVQAPASVASIRIACTEHQLSAPSTSTVQRHPAADARSRLNSRRGPRPRPPRSDSLCPSYGCVQSVPYMDMYLYVACARHLDCCTWMCTWM